MNNELPDFLEPLRTISRPFPEAAVLEVVERRNEAIPHLIKVLEQFPARWTAGEVDKDEMLVLYAMHLLAEFREPRAYRALVRVARTRGADEFLGDTAADGLQSILAAVWDGDSEPLLELMGDGDADEFARAAGLSAIGVLYEGGQLERSQVLALLDQAYEDKIDRRPGFLWDCWVSVIADFGFSERIEQVRELYQNGLANPGFESLASVEDRILNECEELKLGDYTSFTTTVDAMGWWYSFSPEAAREEVRLSAKSWKKTTAAGSSLPVRDRTVPSVGREAKVGRNDPCPCGSGKKYKKCCLP